MDEFEALFTVHNLCEAFYECIKANKWKASTHIFWSNLMPNISKLHDDLMTGKYEVGETTDFDINERGHLRHIEAPPMRDRIVQKVLCTKILIPQLTPYLIYDNYASLKNRGTSMARRRTEIALRNWHKAHGTEGYVVQLDIKNYFGSVSHDILKRLLRQKLRTSQRVLELIEYFIDTASPNGYGLNLGSEIPQICSVFFPYRLDNWFKIVQRVKPYGRYMDDTFFIVETKEEARRLLDGAKHILDSLGLRLNERKTHIVKLTHGFIFLQTKYSYDKGHVITRPTRAKLSRERRRLKKFRGLVDSGEVSTYEVALWYYAWKKSVMKDYNSCYNSLRTLDAFFSSLFPVIKVDRKKTRRMLIDEAYKEIEYEDCRYIGSHID